MCACAYGCGCVHVVCVTEAKCASLCVVDAVGRWRVQTVFRGGSRGPRESRGGSRRGWGLFRVRVLQREVIDQRSASTHCQGQRSTPGQEERDSYSMSLCETAECNVTEAETTVPFSSEALVYAFETCSDSCAMTRVAELSGDICWADLNETFSSEPS